VPTIQPLWRRRSDEAIHGAGAVLHVESGVRLRCGGHRALGPDLMVRVVPGGGGLRISGLSGEGADRLPPDSTNRVIEAAHRAARDAGSIPLPGCGAVDPQLHPSSAAGLVRGRRARRGPAGRHAAGRAIGRERLLGRQWKWRATRTTWSALRAERKSRCATRRRHPVLPIEIGAPLRAALYIPIRSWPLGGPIRAAQAGHAGDAVHNLGRAALLVAALTEGGSSCSPRRWTIAPPTCSRRPAAWLPCCSQRRAREAPAERRSRERHYGVRIVHHGEGGRWRGR